MCWILASWTNLLLAFISVSLPEVMREMGISFSYEGSGDSGGGRGGEDSGDDAMHTARDDEPEGGDRGGGCKGSYAYGDEKKEEGVQRRQHK